MKIEMLNTRVRRVKKSSMGGYPERVRSHLYLRVLQMILENLVNGKYI